MNEVQWMKTFADVLEKRLRATGAHLTVRTGMRLPYANEVRSDVHTMLGSGFCYFVMVLKGCLGGGRGSPAFSHAGGEQ